jgi:hypothetical protein
MGAKTNVESLACPTFQAARLTWGAQGAMALRLMKLANGGTAAQSKANGMSTEKVAASAEAQPVAVTAVPTTAVLNGCNGAPTGKNVSNTSKNKVRANKGRPSR